MTTRRKSILVISPNTAIAETIGNALASDLGVRVVAQTSTLAQMNGSAVKMIAEHDIVLFETSPDDESDLRAIRLLAAAKPSGTTLVALADGNISLAQARALNSAGVDEVLPIPVLGGAFADQMSRLNRATGPSRLGHADAGRIIAVAQARGGIGSTTVAVNLADQLVGGGGFLHREKPHAVALLDFDLQFGSVGSFLDLGEQETLLQLALDGTIPDHNFLSQSMVKMPNGLSVLAAPSKFAPLDSLRSEQVAAILDTLRQSHDFIVVDLPRALIGWIEPIIQRADELIIVTDISVSSVRHCRRLIDFFTADNVALPVEIVVNHERRPMFQSAMHREAAKVLRCKLNHWLPHDPRAASAAAGRGKPLSAVAPRSSLGKAMTRLAKTTMAALPVPAQRPSK